MFKGQVQLPLPSQQHKALNGHNSKALSPTKDKDQLLLTNPA